MNHKSLLPPFCRQHGKIRSNRRCFIICDKSLALQKSTVTTGIDQPHEANTSGKRFDDLKNGKGLGFLSPTLEGAMT